MTDSTLHEVTEIAIIKHASKGVLLIYSDRQSWHFPDVTLAVGEAWDERLLAQIEAMTGLSKTTIDSILAIDNFQPGEVAEQPQYGVFFLCDTDTSDVTLGDDVEDFVWIDDMSALNNLELFHPEVEDMVKRALNVQDEGDSVG